MIVRAEQLFAAYRQMLPPRTAPRQPLRLVVFGAMTDYETFLRRLGLTIQNRACFLESQNLVAVGSELSRMKSVLAKGTAQNDQLRQELRTLEMQLSERLRTVGAQAQTGRHVQERYGPAAGAGTPQVRRPDQAQPRGFGPQRPRDPRIFNENARQMLARLAHESFHAYLRNYVYPQEYAVPYWLNEGLAVMFEGGVLDGSVLRIDAPNPAALKALREDLQGEQPLELVKVLAAGQGEFVMTGDVPPKAARALLCSCLGPGVLFGVREAGARECRVGSFCPARPGGSQPAGTPFEQLIGGPLEQFEPQWLAENILHSPPGLVTEVTSGGLEEYRTRDRWSLK